MKAIIIIHQMQEKCLAKHRTLCLTFLDFKKAFDSIPRKVVSLALKMVGTDQGHYGNVQPF